MMIELDHNIDERKKEILVQTYIYPGSDLVTLDFVIYLSHIPRNA